MNSKIKKQFIEINGLPLFYYSAKILSEIDEIDKIIIVTTLEDVEFVKNIVNNLKKVINVIPGGERRQDSVKAAIDVVPENYEFVLIHDSARPFVKPGDIKNVIRNGIEYDCSVLGVKVKDTIKETDENGFVKTTHNREFLYSIQTPQVVDKNLLIKGFKDYKDCTFTDDTGILEQLGIKTKITNGSYSNIKITTKEDLVYLKDLI